MPAARRASVVYLPPGFERGRRYPVLYLLQGFHGAPRQFSDGLRLADFADAAITSGRSRPFIAVAAPAGVTSMYDGEWAGPWESYLVDDVVPWVERHLPVARTLDGRAVPGSPQVDTGRSTSASDTPGSLGRSRRGAATSGPSATARSDVRVQRPSQHTTRRCSSAAKLRSFAGSEPASSSPAAERTTA